MSNIWIFGDSFAKPNEPSHDYTTWHDHLYSISGEEQHNFALSGIGSMHIMDNIYDKIEDGSVNDKDKFIVFLSDAKRIPFNFLKSSKDEVNVSYYYELRYKIGPSRGKKWAPEIDPDSSLDDLEPYKDHMDVFYETCIKEIERYNLKSILYLKHLAVIKKLKILIFTCFNNFFIFHETYKISKLNDPDFKVFDFPLIRVGVTGKSFDGEKCVNHLRKKDHKILANVMSNFFYLTDFDEKFSKYTDYDEFDEAKRSKKMQYDKFVYK
tara:strand:- start:9688 stop:10488 length:801 start_codon:yes stop_codon:yes gene_type:complete